MPDEVGKRNYWLIVVGAADLKCRSLGQSPSDTCICVHRFSLATWRGRNAILHDAIISSKAILHAAMDSDISQMYVQ